MISFSERSSILSSSGTSGLRDTWKPLSMHGGAGGYGTRASRAPAPRVHEVVTNEKETMKDLNDRLASYLEKVRSLETSNQKLELQIREYCEKLSLSDPTVRDHSKYLTLIAELRLKISTQQMENQKIIFQMSDVQFTVDDFKCKWGEEEVLRGAAEADMSRLRSVQDSLTLTRPGLEQQIQTLTEELVQMKTNHSEETHLLQAQRGGSVSVEVDCSESVDLARVLGAVRQRYEALMERNTSELQRWFQTQVEGFETQKRSDAEEGKSFNGELSELKRTFQTHKVSQESLLSEVGNLRVALEEVQGRAGMQLSHLQGDIDALEQELQRIRGSVEMQRADYCSLLDLKMRLELEIEEYRRLLGGELDRKAAVVNSAEDKAEERKPHIARRTRTIVEEIVDGVVVNHRVDTQIEDIQK